MMYRSMSGSLLAFKSSCTCSTGAAGADGDTGASEGTSAGAGATADNAGATGAGAGAAATSDDGGAAAPTDSELESTFFVVSPPAFLSSSISLAYFSRDFILASYYSNTKAGNVTNK